MKPLTKYSHKFHKSFIGKCTTRLLMKPSLMYDFIKDSRICRCSLVKYVPSLYRESMGATGSQSTSYVVLKHIFSFVEFKEGDSFIDVGCGKGRVLAFLADKGFDGNINGIELNKDVAAYAQKWSRRYSNVHIQCGDAFSLNYDKYNVLSLGRPFEPPAFYKFIDVLEGSVNHSITFIYWWDSQSGNYLQGRKGWTLKKRQWFYNSGIVYHALYPQRFSIWEYQPESV